MDSSSPYKPLEESCKSDVGGSVATILLYPMFRFSPPSMVHFKSLFNLSGYHNKFGGTPSI